MQKQPWPHSRGLFLYICFFMKLQAKLKSGAFCKNQNNEKLFLKIPSFPFPKNGRNKAGFKKPLSNKFCSVEAVIN